MIIAHNADLDTLGRLTKRKLVASALQRFAWSRECCFPLSHVAAQRSSARTSETKIRNAGTQATTTDLRPDKRPHIAARSGCCFFRDLCPRSAMCAPSAQCARWPQALTATLFSTHCRRSGDGAWTMIFGFVRAASGPRGPSAPSRLSPRRSRQHNAPAAASREAGS